jgi:nicotinamide-nucleotide amidase
VRVSEPPSGALRAGIVITGTEVLTGRRRDRNGPWLAERLRAVGVEPAHIEIVGDRRADMLDALRFMVSEALDLVITSGGLGPTADDLTVEVVAELQGVEMELDPVLEGRISEIVASLRARFPSVDPQALAAGTRKQATVPVGATVLEPVGTAPGLVLAPARGDRPTVVVLPGPPRELQPMWEAALQTDALRAVLDGARKLDEGVLRLYGIPESELAASLRDAEAAGIMIDELEITTCLHGGEIEVTTSYEPRAQASYGALVRFLSQRHAGALFSSDGSTVDEQVAALLLEGSLTIATAESCTGGLLAARLTDLPGSSRYVVGGVVAYSDEVKSSALGVTPALIARHGAVSGEVAAALADGACARLGADLGVGITGVAGPGGGSAAKPVGLVWLSVAAQRTQTRLTRSVRLPGGRDDVRERATTVAMHLVRRWLLELLPDAQLRAPYRGPQEERRAADDQAGPSSADGSVAEIRAGTR